MLKSTSETIESLASMMGSTVQEARTVLVNEAITSKGMQWLVDSNVAEKLNIVFDIDHTLIVSYDRRNNKSGFIPGSYPDTHILTLDKGHEMVLVVRQGVHKMLEFLS